jgi:hypothetical protein
MEIGLMKMGNQALAVEAGAGVIQHLTVEPLAIGLRARHIADVSTTIDGRAHLNRILVGELRPPLQGQYRGFSTCGRAEGPIVGPFLDGTTERSRCIRPREPVSGQDQRQPALQLYASASSP